MESTKYKTGSFSVVGAWSDRKLRSLENNRGEIQHSEQISQIKPTAPPHPLHKKKEEKKSLFHAKRWAKNEVYTTEKGVTLDRKNPRHL